MEVTGWKAGRIRIQQWHVITVEIAFLHLKLHIIVTNIRCDSRWELRICRIDNPLLNRYQVTSNGINCIQSSLSPSTFTAVTPALGITATDIATLSSTGMLTWQLLIDWKQEVQLQTNLALSPVIWLLRVVVIAQQEVDRLRSDAGNFGDL